MSAGQEAPPSPYIVGPPVLSDDLFFGRSDQIRAFFRALNGSQLQPVRVLGVRRSGKTSFLKYVSQPDIYRQRITTPGPPVIFAYVDLQAGIHEPLGFFQAVADAIIRAAPDDGTLSCPPRFDGFRGFDNWLRDACLQYRLVVLLDEFEVLGRAESFDLSFFQCLRALVSGNMVWVTASFRDVVEISTFPGKERPASPLYNVFYTSPIYLGPLEESEAEKLIREPAGRHDVSFSNDEVRAIRDIAGDMPYLLQATADLWFQAVVEGVKNGERADTVTAQLLRHDSQIRAQLAAYWRTLGLKEQDRLRRMAASKARADDVQNDEFNERLESFGLFKRRGRVLRLASDIFRQWIDQFSNVTPTVAHVFIGHGRKDHWRVVKDELKNLGLKCVFYESEPREGQSIVPILEKMLGKVEFAVVVVTAEDKMGKRKRRPRQNVVHETGLFQGALGFHRVVLLVQKGVELLSNLDGVQHIFFKGRDIESTLPRLYTILRREQVL